MKHQIDLIDFGAFIIHGLYHFTIWRAFGDLSVVWHLLLSRVLIRNDFIRRLSLEI